MKLLRPLFIGFLAACSGNGAPADAPPEQDDPPTEEAEVAEESTPEDFKDADRMAGAVVFHHAQNATIPGTDYVIHDDVADKDWTVEAFQEAEDFQTDVKEAHRLVQATAADGTALVLDYTIEWSDDDEMLEVTDVAIQKVGDESARWTYDKRGDFYVRQDAQ